MVEMTTYAPGMPSWTDVSTPNMEATKEFYGGLFGWEGATNPEMGGYTNFHLNGKMASGATPTMSPDQQPAWSTYFATDNADATAQAVQDNGGQVFMAPMDVMDLGRMAIFTDPTGAFFGVWQAGVHKGAGVMVEPGARCWSQLLTRDIHAANAFYPAVFGWVVESDEDGDAVWYLDGQPVAAGHTVGAEYRAEAPPSWLTYFLVTNTDTTVAQAQAAGGTVIMQATDSEYGRSAVLADPYGAVFAIIQSPE